MSMFDEGRYQLTEAYIQIQVSNKARDKLKAKPTSQLEPFGRDDYRLGVGVRRGVTTTEWTA